MKNETIKPETIKTETAKKVNTVKKPETTKAKPAPKAKPETVKQETIINPFTRALMVRKELAPVEQHKQIEHALHALSDNVVTAAKKVMTQTDFDAVANMLQNSDKKAHSGYMQVKSIVKLADIVRALAQGIRPTSNNLCVAISALLHNGNHANIKELIVAQSRAARETDMMNVRSDYQARSATYTIGTASSQTGQVRDVMRVLDFATVNKGKRNDDLILNEYGLKVLGAVFGK
ncbi:hypothetical protein [Ferrovum sp.]|uniref:hypothetical protein n=1 Tax=Ferrovum sp. TaxID=2609467 RepID=UPI00262FC91E|nr:hypothetical protein [Ferrovum sp.]